MRVVLQGLVGKIAYHLQPRIAEARVPKSTVG